MTSSSTTATIKPFEPLSSDSGFSLGGILTGLATDYAYLPGFMGIFLAPTRSRPRWVPQYQSLATLSCRGCRRRTLRRGRGAAGAAAAGGALGSGFAGGLGGFAGLGQAASVGTLSVPQGWGWAATPQAAMMGGVPLASALPGVNCWRDKWATTSGWATDDGAGCRGPQGWLPQRAWVVQLPPNTRRGSPCWRARGPPDTHPTRHPRQPRRIQYPPDFRRTDTRPPDTRRPSCTCRPMDMRRKTSDGNKAHSSLEVTAAGVSG